MVAHSPTVGGGAQMLAAQVSGRLGHDTSDGDVSHNSCRLILLDIDIS